MTQLEFIKDGHKEYVPKALKDLETQNLLKNSLLVEVYEVLTTYKDKEHGITQDGKQKLLELLSFDSLGLIQTNRELSNINYSLNACHELIHNLKE